MHDDEGARIAAAAGIPEREAVEELIEPPQGERLAWVLRWDKKAAAEQLCEGILQQQPGLSERELWRALAAYLRTGGALSPRLLSAEFVASDRQKLCERIRVLIGRLPAESLQDFSGLVAFTETFLSRVQFVCDLVVYLFAEREKGLESEGSEGQRYVEFFVQKLMWELDVVSRIAEQHPLSALEGEYLDWLTDRILDDEVLL